MVTVANANDVTERIENFLYFIIYIFIFILIILPLIIYPICLFKFNTDKTIVFYYMVEAIIIFYLNFLPIMIYPIYFFKFITTKSFCFYCIVVVNIIFFLISFGNIYHYLFSEIDLFSTFTCENLMLTLSLISRPDIYLVGI